MCVCGYRWTVTVASAMVNPFMISLVIVAVLILAALLLVLYYLARWESQFKLRLNIYIILW